MKIEFESKSEKQDAEVGRENYEVFLATCNEKDDRLLFVKYGELIMGINLIDGFVIQADIYFNLYKDLKRVSKLEVKAILGEE